jgi:hypothetical protein
LPKRRHPGRAPLPRPSIRPARGGAYDRGAGLSSLPASSVYLPPAPRPQQPKRREDLPEALHEVDRAYVLREMRRILAVTAVVLTLLIIAAVLL